MDLVNERRSLVWVAMKATFVVVGWLVVAAGLSLVYGYGSLGERYVAPPEISLQTADTPSMILSARGFVVGGLRRGGRAWTAYEDLSPALVAAVVASEDARFFHHTGVDLRGIARAAQVNAAEGGNSQGGSTITQQLAKSFVGDARTYMRKLEELVIARRLEVTYSKPQIFEAYINRIYFGAGATGIGAAADIFFGVTPAELTLSQSALLTAMIPAPSRYNPFNHPAAALERRDRVLERLEATGLASAHEVAAARGEGLGLRSPADDRARAPEIARAVWRELDQRDSTRDWRREGLHLQTGIDLVRQRRAQGAVRDALFGLDQRQGLRGHVARLAPGAADTFRAAWTAQEAWGSVRLGYVIDVSEHGLRVWSGGELEVPEEGWSWAVQYLVDASNHGAQLSTPIGAFEVGDVVLIREGQVVQWPQVEGAYGSTDIAGEYYEALVGGREPQESHFDRFTQGCRQPGSTFKPIVYTAALDYAGYNPASTLRDAPMRIVLGPNEEWRPRNGDGSFDGYITLWQALIWSRNLPALQLYQDVGPRRTIERARRLGITSPLDGVESLGLGASCLAPEELLEVYTSIARGGFGFHPELILSIDNSLQGRGGRPEWFPRADPSLRLASLWGSEPPQRRLREETAFQMAFLLSEVVRMGTGGELRSLGFPVAGKTGTTNAFDAWFSGYTARDTATLWIGSDRNTRSLGRRESGGHLALPAWGAAMLPVDSDWPLMPPLPDRMSWVSIDPETGLRAGEGRWGVPMPFRWRQAPSGEGQSQVEHEAFYIDRVGSSF